MPSRRTLLAAGLLALALICASAPAGAFAADPAGFRGTITITHDFRVEPGTGIESRISGTGFDATYRLRGRRWQGRGAQPRSYLLTGRGREVLDVLRRDVRQTSEGRSELAFIGRASGTVRLVRRPNEPRETGPLLLRLRPGGRFTLGLRPLEGGENGLSLNFYLERNDQQSCITTAGDQRGRMTYFRGVFEISEVQRCPDAEPFPGSTRGKERRPTIWGGNVWNPPESSFPQPDLCRGITAGLANLTVCGRFGGGRIAGAKTVDGRRGYFTSGICAFFPRGESPRRLPDPIAEPFVDACGQMDLGGLWRRITTVRWNLRPVG